MNTSPTTELVNNSKELTAQSDYLRRAVDELTMLNELSLSISGTIDTKEIMNTIVDRAVCFIGARQGNITLQNETLEERSEMLVRNTCSSKELEPIEPQKTILTWIQSHRKPLRLNDPQAIATFIEWGKVVKSVLSVPLIVRSRLLGMLTIYNKKNAGRFTEQDERLLSIIASQSAQVLENARLSEKEQKLHEIEKEVEVAKKIQNQLLPDESPSLDQYSVSGKSITAEAVGGDYYDFIKLGDHRWVICLGDVSGKGLPASLLMSNLQALVRGELPCHSSPGKLLENVNEKLFNNTDTQKFATLFMGILDTASHRLTYSNAGHEHPYIIHSDNNFNRLQTGGLPLGVLKNQNFEEQTINFYIGDQLVIYSDGITDNRNSNNEAFGEKRIEKLLLTEDGSELLSNIYEVSTSYGNRSKQFDDMTAVVLSRTH